MAVPYVRKLLCLVSLLSMSIPAVARAGYRRVDVTVHGSACTPLHGSNILPWADENGLFNRATTTMTVGCAIPRSTYAEAYIGRETTPYCDRGISPPTVELIDNSTTHDVGCRLLVLDGGNRVMSSFTTSSAGQGNRPTPILMQFTVSVERLLQPGERLYVDCTLPPGGNTLSSSSAITAINVPVCENF